MAVQGEEDASVWLYNFLQAGEQAVRNVQC